MPQIRQMTTADVPLGMHLKRQAGWNQVEADWLRLLELEPDGCFVAEVDGAAVGTVACCVFQSVGWIALLLVEENARRQGVGTALMSQALAYLEHRQVRTIRLDATPLGQPLYEKLGFATDYTLTRYHGVLPAARAVGLVRPLRLAQFADVILFDAAACGCDRVKLLERLFEEYPRALRVLEREGQVLGYAAARPGSNALQLGPCIASPVAGPVLFADLCARFSGRPVYLDIPESNAPAISIAASMGLQPQRQLVRMSRGEKLTERVDDIWASSGPEKG